MSTAAILNTYSNAAATNTSNSSAKSSAASTSSTASLGENDFMTLLIAQLKNQDPLNPQDSSAFVAELAQFSSLQQETNINQNLQQAAADSMIGMNITAGGNTGVVTSVSSGSNNSNGVQLNITNSSGTSSTVNYSDITQVSGASGQQQSTNGQGTGSQ